MSSLDLIALESRTFPSQEVVAGEPVPRMPETNGVAASGTSHASGVAERSAVSEANSVKRAEEMVDRIAERVSGFTVGWGRGIIRIFSRIKEEAEDIWAEAQGIRRGDRP